MAAYSWTVTNTGLSALVSSQVNGTVLNFTSVQIGSGQIGNGNPGNQTTLINPQVYVSISNSNTLVQYQASLEFSLSTSQITTSFPMYEIGIWASLNGASPILFAYGYTLSPDTITPSGGSSSEVYNFQVGIKYSQDANVTVTLSYTVSVPLHANTHIQGASGPNGGIDPLPTATISLPGLVPTSPNDPTQALLGTNPVSFGYPHPSGMISLFGGSIAPGGWLLCNGASYSKSSYPGLFSVIGYTYGGSGSTFKVPNLVGNVAVGAGTGWTLGSTGGSSSHELTVNQLPSHSHSISDLGHSHGVGDPGHTHNYDYSADNAGTPYAYTIQAGSDTHITDVATTTTRSTTGISIDSAVTGISINNTGGGASFSLMQPYVCLSYIIKY